MKNCLTFTILIIVAFLASCDRTTKHPQYGTNAATDSLKQLILSKVEAYYSDMSARDWDDYSAHFWPDAHLTTVWQPPDSDSLQVIMTTIEEFVEQADEGPGSQPIFEEKLLKADIKVYNNLASVWADYAAKFGTQDSLMEWQGIDAFTYMKHKGEWRIVSLAYTNINQ